MAEVAQENPGYEWEFLIVNDGSTDDTLQRIKALHNSDPRFSYIDLSRNYGKEIAMMAGFDYASGDAVIIMDSDMQHPVSSIPEMLRLWEEGWQDVYAQRKSSKESWFKRKSSELYYRLLQNTTRIPIQKNTGDFRLLDRVCINALREMRETQRNTKGMYCWIGFRKKGITYEQLDASTAPQMAVLEPYEPCPRRPDGLHNLTVAHSVDSRHHLLHNRVCLSGIYPCQHTPVWRPRCRLSHHYGHNPVYRRRAAAVARHNRRIPRKSVQREQTPPALFCKHLQQPPDRFRTGLIPTPPHHRQ